MKKIETGAAIFGALAVTGFGIGSGVAAAEQQLPDSPSVIWKLDHGHGHGGEGRDRDRRDWDAWRGEPAYYGPAYYGPCVWVPPAVAVWVPPAVC